MSLRRVFIFLGPPGSGKGTIASECVQKEGWQQISTGNVCRRHIAQRTELGSMLSQKINAGQLVPDEIIGQMLAQELQKADAHTIILDGFPRTRTQAQMLVDLFNEMNASFTQEVVEFVVPTKEVVDRIVYRTVCSNKACQTPYSLKKGSVLAPKVAMVCDICGHALQQRSDDTESTIRTRVEEYEKHKSAILNFYDTIKIPVVKINADQNIQLVFAEFQKNVL